VSLTIVAQIPISSPNLVVRVTYRLCGRRAAGESAKTVARGGRCALEALQMNRQHSSLAYSSFVAERDVATQAVLATVVKHGDCAAHLGRF
jgi:hypothetical protein